LRLTWKAPSRNEDGSAESVNLEMASVLRRVMDVPPPPPPAAEPPEPPEPETPNASSETTPVPTEPAGETQPAETTPPSSEAPEGPAPPPFRSEAVVVNETDSSGLAELRHFEEPLDPAWIGKRVEYAVVYRNRKGRESRLSEIARIDPASPLTPPGAPTLEPGQGLVALKWSAPADAPPGVAFSVHRRLADAKVYPDAPLNPEPLSTPSFEDRSAVFGVPSCYVVSAVLSTPGTVSSLPSEEACITPEDRFPPPAPSGLVAVPSESAVLLSWREAEASDLKGYRVYRGDSAEGPFGFLAEVTETSYTDETAESDETYFYAVTAIDNASGTNESDKSEAVEARRAPRNPI
jgi:hypothetical protein